MSKKKSYETFNVELLNKPKKQTIAIKSGYSEQLEAALSIPSTMHSYSIAIEYMRDWFLNCVDRDRKYFKTVYVNGSHILSDYKKFSIIQSLYRDTPAVAITPNIDFDYDRDMLDSYMGGKNLLIRKYNHRQGFFQDVENNIYLGMNVREQRMQFNFKCKVESRAMQLDLLRNIELSCRTGFTIPNYISCDFHIPMEIMLNIADHAGFEIIKDEKKETETIKDIIGFTTYLNKHSKHPIMYKLRGVSGKNEFFMRVNRVYAHINNTEKLSYDDGEREGHLENNFNIEMSCILTMWVPAFYVYKSHKTIYKHISTIDSSTIGLWSLNIVEIPETNKMGWNKLMNTEYELDDKEKESEEFYIDISGLFLNKNIYTIIKLNLQMGISPSRFIDIKFFEVNNPNTLFYTDWENMRIKVKNCDNSSLLLAIYIDTEYYNGQLITIKDMESTRIE